MKRLLILLLLLPVYLFGQNNETEISSYIQGLTAIHTESAYKALMDDIINVSAVKKKDRINTRSASGTTTLDFNAADVFQVTQTGNLSYTISNLVNGQIGYLVISKSSSYTVAFSNSTVLLPFQTAYNYNSATSVILKLINKNGNIYTVPQGYYSDVLASETYLGSVEKATTAEAQAGTANKYIDAARLQDVTATETRKGIVEKATFNQLEIGTPDVYPDAATILALEATDDENNYGLMRFANPSEANALTEVDAAISPGRLPISSTTQEGLVELATDAETVTGTSTTLSTTPLGVSDAIDDKLEDAPAWVALSLETGWSGNLYYSRNERGIVSIRAEGLKYIANYSLLTPLKICALGTSLRSISAISVPIYSNSGVLGSSTVSEHHIVVPSSISSAGLLFQPQTDSYTNNHTMYFEIRFSNE